MAGENGAQPAGRAVIEIAGRKFGLVMPGEFTYRESMRAEELAGMSTAELLASFDEKRFSTRSVYAIIMVSAKRAGVQIPNEEFEANWIQLTEAFTSAFDQAAEQPPGDPTSAPTGSDAATTTGASKPSSSSVSTG